MRFDVEFKGSYSILFVTLSPGESILAETGALVSMTGNVNVETSTGGIFKALKRALLGGEHLFLNKFSALSKSRIAFAPRLPGDIEVVSLNGGLIVQSTSFLASDVSIDLDTKFGGFKSFFAGEGFFLLKLSGIGKAAISSFGAIYTITLDAGEKLTVDTGHIVAFDETMSYSVRTFGGIKSTLFGGEGLVCDFVGPGRIFIQTRNYPDFVSWIKSLVPKDTGSR
ncbi:TIGR00266 family protein [Thermosipho ferrireducens]|uniref:TIGR00266 family protein n=1 Tax=Thermosipho ferrireducens TaxID=2571116 RepID=A0ABX7S6L2_9BACT|nr:TIGR00266 family protein [Thermosipho ferrireducens]QTA37217.1 TIGR00266 family protein [Thermosipho ferrireducens]